MQIKARVIEQKRVMPASSDGKSDIVLSLHLFLGPVSREYLLQEVLPALCVDKEVEIKV